LGHSFVGTEHLLLALFDSTDGVAAHVLGEAGIKRSMVETQVLALIKRGTGSEEGELPFTPRAKGVLRDAVGEALRLGHNYVGTEHLLLGLFSDTDAVAAKVLIGLGASYDALRARTIQMLTGYGAD
jgi:ATP-dependent Clp protease ATP-binding subunit ClpA